MNGLTVLARGEKPIGCMFWLWAKLLAAGTSAARALDGSISSAVIQARSITTRILGRTACLLLGFAVG